MTGIYVRRLGKVTLSDLPVVTELLKTFDEITFNSDGEILAQKKFYMPVIGPIVVSFWLRERSLRVWRDGSQLDEGVLVSEHLSDHKEFRYGDDNDMNGIPRNWTVLYAFVRGIVRQSVCNAL